MEENSKEPRFEKQMLLYGNRDASPIPRVVLEAVKEPGRLTESGDTEWINNIAMTIKEIAPQSCIMNPSVVPPGRAAVRGAIRLPLQAQAGVPPGGSNSLRGGA